MAEIQRAMNLASEFVRGGKVIVDGLDGAVVVEGWDRDEVSLAATKHVSAASEADAERALEDMQTAFRRSGDELTISVTGSGRGGYAAGWVDCYIRVPAESDVYVDTSSGNVDVRGVSGRIRLDTGSGSATLRQCGGDIVVDTSSGDVVADDIGGDLNVDTASGGVTVNGVSGGLFVDTAGGAVNVRHVSGKVTIDSCNVVNVSETGSDLVIDTTAAVRAMASRGRFAHIDSGGPVEAEFLVRSGGRYTIDAGGEAKISVPPMASLEIRGEAPDFRYELPLDIQRMEDSEFEATLNGRGARLHVDIGGRLTLLPSEIGAEATAEQVQPGAEASPSAEPAVGTGPAPVADAGETGPDIRAIIQMVADKKITPEEADELLKAISIKV